MPRCANLLSSCLGLCPFGSSCLSCTYSKTSGPVFRPRPVRSSQSLPYTRPSYTPSLKPSAATEQSPQSLCCVHVPHSAKGLAEMRLFIHQCFPRTQHSAQYTQTLHQCLSVSMVLGTEHRVGQKSGPWTHENCDSRNKVMELERRKDLSDLSSHYASVPSS